MLFKPHPWYGISPGERVPLKYEIDKVSGYLKVDRPQKSSNICPALYGFIPQTFCGESVAAFSSEKTGLSLAGDSDPLDICVLTDRPIPHGNIIVDCIPIGGFRTIDHREADDKIIDVLKHDSAYGSFTDIEGVPVSMLERLRHYFLPYKFVPDRHRAVVKSLTLAAAKRHARQFVAA